MIALLKLLRLALLVTCGLISFAGCVKQETPQATPEATKKFLKLRGYHFDQESFFAAAAGRDIELVKAFLQAGMNPNVQDPRDGRTVLISSAARGDSGVVKAMLEANADPNIKDKAGYTAVFHSIEARYDEATELLIGDPRLDLNARGKNGLTVLISYVWR